MKFREHRGGLADSMSTVEEFNTIEQFVEYLTHIFPTIDIATLQVNAYGHDSRINWDTHIVTAQVIDWARSPVVLGFTDGPLNALALE